MQIQTDIYLKYPIVLKKNSTKKSEEEKMQQLSKMMAMIEAR